MGDFMSFVQADYGWFILIGIILLLALIGYIAEKSGYKKVDAEEKPKEPTKPVETNVVETAKEVVEEPQKEVIEEPKLEIDPRGSDIILEEPKEKSKNKDKKKQKEEIQEVVPTFDDLNISLEPMNEVITEPTINLDVKPMEEDLNVPLGEVKEEVKVEEIPADLYAPLETTVQEEPKIEEIPAIDAELPDLENIKDTKEEVTNEDDIWKF